MSQTRASPTARSSPIAPQFPPPTDNTCDALGAGNEIAFSGASAFGSGATFTRHEFHLRLAKFCGVLRRFGSKIGRRRCRHRGLDRKLTTSGCGVVAE